MRVMGPTEFVTTIFCIVSFVMSLKYGLRVYLAVKHPKLSAALAEEEARRNERRIAAAKTAGGIGVEVAKIFLKK